jgi:hypothetical protein
VLPAVISGVVSEHWAGHWLPRIRRKQIDQQRLSEFGQVISQLLFPGRLMITPSVSFGVPVTESILRGEIKGGGLLSAVIAREKKLLVEHCRLYGGNPGL